MGCVLIMVLESENRQDILAGRKHHSRTSTWEVKSGEKLEELDQGKPKSLWHQSPG